VTNTNGEVIGAYQAVNKLGPYKFTASDCKRLSLAATLCEKSLESHMLYSEALQDQLTGIKNRRGFYDHYEKQIVPIMYNHPVSLIICDIDFFKKVNDTYRHNAGDAVLIHVAEIIASNCRVDDGFFRWGGEEFILLLPKTGINEGAEIAERIRAEVEKSICTFDNFDIRVTLSLGVAELIPNALINDIVKIADEKLYIAKEQGRNRVIK
jgi:diguanylate cyclase (GGDEF)-like protein